MTKEILETTLSALRQLEASTARSQVAELYDEIIHLVDKGVTLKSIHSTLNDNGIDIKIFNFYTYIRQESARRAKNNSLIQKQGLSISKNRSNVLKTVSAVETNAKETSSKDLKSENDFRIKTFDHSLYKGEDIL